MCFPAVGAVAGFALSAASSLASFGAQQQQYAAQEQQYNQNYQNALADNRTTETALNQREMEENASYTQKDQLALIEGAQKVSQVKVAAATGGIAGNAIQEITNGIGVAINQKRADLQTNWQATSENIETQKTSAVDQEMSRIGEVANPYEPSIGGTLLSIAGAGFKAAASPSGQNFFGTVNPGTSSSGAGLNVQTFPTIADDSTGGN